jgi:hypothetical protein
MELTPAEQLSRAELHLATAREAGRKEPRKRLLEDLRKDSRLTDPTLQEAVRELGSLPDHVDPLDWFSKWLQKARAPS